MAVKPYKVNKEGSIDFILAAIRGGLSGSLQGKQMAEERKKVEREFDLKIASLELDRQQVKQQWDMHLDTMKQRQEELEQQQEWDVAKIKMTQSHDKDMAKTALAGQLVNTTINAMIDEERGKKDTAVKLFLSAQDKTLAEKELAIREKESDVRIKDAALDRQYKLANMGIERQRIGLEERRVESSERSQSRQEAVALANMQEDLVKMRGAKIQLENKIGKEIGATPEQLGSLPKDAILYIKQRNQLALANDDTKKSRSWREQYANISQIAGYYEFNNLKKDSTIYVYEEKNNAPDKKKYMKYSDWIETDEGKSFNEREPVGDTSLISDVDDTDITSLQQYDNAIQELQGTVDIYKDIYLPTKKPNPLSMIEEAVTKPTATKQPTKAAVKSDVDKSIPATVDDYFDYIAYIEETRDASKARDFIINSRAKAIKKYGSGVSAQLDTLLQRLR